MRFWITFWVCIGAALVLAAVLGACGDAGGNTQPWPAPVCATWQAPDGTWMEEDNEPVDADPCDLEVDLDRHPLVTKKPTPKKSPPRTSQPLGRNTRGFR